jgi:hypothetical protein
VIGKERKGHTWKNLSIGVVLYKLGGKRDIDWSEINSGNSVSGLVTWQIILRQTSEYPLIMGDVGTLDEGATL